MRIACVSVCVRLTYFYAANSLNFAHTDYTRKIRGHTAKFGYVNDVERQFYLAFIVQLPSSKSLCARVSSRRIDVRTHRQLRATVWNSDWQLVTDLKQFIRFIKKRHIKIDDDVTTPAISKSFFFHWNCSFYPLWSIIFFFFFFISCLALRKHNDQLKWIGWPLADADPLISIHQ